MELEDLPDGAAGGDDEMLLLEPLDACAAPQEPREVEGGAGGVSFSEAESESGEADPTDPVPARPPAARRPTTRAARAAQLA
eukprot:3659548-Prymnesium_polylepis.1